MTSKAKQAAVVAGAVTAVALMGTTPTANAATLPSYSQWISDVTVVDNQALADVNTRLSDSSIVKPAIVLDIDNTSLETTYSGETVNIPAVAPTLAAAKAAAAKGAAVFFITGRAEVINGVTSRNLKNVGYPVTSLYARGLSDLSNVQAFKTSVRKNLTAEGYDIIANIGNNLTDLNGGYADTTYKLPDYNGQLD